MTVVAAAAPLSAAGLQPASLDTRPLSAAPCGTAVAHVAVLVADTPTISPTNNGKLSTTSEFTI